MKPFILIREEDVTGISGTGVVAEGVEWLDGTVAIRWQSENNPNSTVIWNSIKDALKIHGHNGKTRVLYYDDGLHLLFTAGTHGTPT